MALSWLMHAICAQVERLPYCPNFMIETKDSRKKINMCCCNDNREVLKSSSSSLKKFQKVEDDDISGFQMPLHYPRYKMADYEKMEEWKLDMLLKEYGLTMFKGTLDEKREFAIGVFLWPDQV